MTLGLISCDQYFSAVPWPEVGVAGLVGFVVGAVLGRAYERSHPRSPSREQKGADDD